MLHMHSWVKLTEIYKLDVGEKKPRVISSNNYIYLDESYPLH